MDIKDRHKRLLRLLAVHGTASVETLSDSLGVSHATVRRDIRLLGTAGQVRRIRGGAGIGAGQGAALKGASFHSGRSCHPERKRAIARYAAAMCGDGETILIGGGTTTCAMTEFLAARQMRILTNSFEVARRLLAGSDNEVILSGGRIYAEQGIILSPFDSEAIQHCYADRLFLGVHGMCSLGLMEADPLLIQAGRRLLGQAQQAVVLADSSKFGNRGGMFLSGLGAIACVVTDDGVADAAVQMLERAGIDVRIVAADPVRDPVRDPVSDPEQDPAHDLADAGTTAPARRHGRSPRPSTTPR